MAIRRLAAFALVAVSTTALFGFDSVARDPRIQDRLYDHLDHAETAFMEGHAHEAEAYVEMVLLKREITIYVNAANVPGEMKEDASRALHDAAINWEDALGRQVHFRFVPFPGADVTVRYADEMRYDGKEAAGLVTWSRQVMDLGSDQYQYQVSATMTLRTASPRGGEMNYRQMLNAAGHELGHILGMEDSGRQGELMGPMRLDRPVERPTSKETQSLLALRQQADVLLQQITGDHGGGLIAMDPVIEVRPQVVWPQDYPVADRKDSSRSHSSRSRTAPVRSPRRDGQAQKRETNAAFNGLGW
ncbi:MAG TPA: matrixin family metalloprotease [Fimbriimonadaceae bacterium]|nr:matrixin family metalloprotease [Fimbriimonadaceae bacterium]